MACRISREDVRAGKKARGEFLVCPDYPWEVLEGEPPRRTGMVMIEFPLMDEARAWYNGSNYAPLRTLRQSGYKLDLLLVESLPS